MSNIMIIGFMGCGKSTIAKALAKKLKFECLDTDALIEQKEGLKIKELFEQRGEEYFRMQEKELFEELRHRQNVVIATGGGFYKALQKDKNIFVVYLRAHFAYIKARLSKNALAKRPLFADEKKAYELYKARLNAYKQRADFILNVEHKSVARLSSLIIKEWQEQEKK